MRVDNKTGYVIVLDEAHHKIHDKELNFFGVYATSTAANAYKDLYIVAASTTECHFEYKVANGAETELVFSINATNTAGTSTAVNTYQFHELATNTSDTTFRTNNTTTSFTGTAIYNEVIPGGTAGNSQGNVGEGRKEIILVNGKFLIRAYNRGSGAQNLSISGNFYEMPE